MDLKTQIEISEFLRTHGIGDVDFDVNTRCIDYNKLQDTIIIRCTRNITSEYNRLLTEYTKHAKEKRNKQDGPKSD